MAKSEKKLKKTRRIAKGLGAAALVANRRRGRQSVDPARAQVRDMAADQLSEDAARRCRGEPR